MKGKSLNGCEFSLVSYANSSAPSVIQIMSKDAVFCIFEDQGKVLISEKREQWEWKKSSFQVPYQSQLTHILITDLIQNKNCSLTTFNESFSLHIPLLEVFSQHLCKLGKFYDQLPIT